MTASLQELATLLGGHVNGNRACCVRAPGIAPTIAALSVTPAKNDDGFTVHSFSGDDRQACIEHVKSRLDPEKRAALAALGADLPARNQRRRRQATRRTHRRAGDLERVRLADRHAGGNRTCGEAVISTCRRTSPATSFGITPMPVERRTDEEDISDARHGRRDARHSNRRNRRGSADAASRPLGEKLDRRMLGVAAGAAIKLDADDAVTHGLAIGEGIETCLTARQLGLRPVWALGSAGAIAPSPSCRVSNASRSSPNMTTPTRRQRTLAPTLARRRARSADQSRRSAARI